MKILGNFAKLKKGEEGFELLDSAMAEKAKELTTSTAPFCATVFRHPK